MHRRHDRLQPHLPFNERELAQIAYIDVQQIERIEEGAFAAEQQLVEVAAPIIIEAYHFPIDNRGLAANGVMPLNMREGAEVIELQFKQPVIVIERLRDADAGRVSAHFSVARSSNSSSVGRISCGDGRVRADLQRVIEVVNMNDWVAVDAALISTFTATSLPGAT